MRASCKKVGKGGGVGAAAYRSAERLHDKRTGRTYNYERKRGVVKKRIVVPRGCRWAEDRNSLWNAAEAAERRQRAVVAREWLLSLPAELSAAHREALAEAFAVELVTRYGVAADLAIHLPSEHGDERNHHAHILTTSRVVEPEGLGAKTRVLDDLKTGPVEITAMRGIWAQLCNEALARAGSETRWDARTLKAQREEALAEGDLARAALLDRAPTRHRGPRREHARELREVRAAQLAEEAAELARAQAAARQAAAEARAQAKAEAARQKAERGRQAAEAAQEAARAAREQAARDAKNAAERAAAEAARQETEEAARIEAERAALRARVHADGQDREADLWWSERVGDDPLAVGVAIGLYVRPDRDHPLPASLDEALATGRTRARELRVLLDTETAPEAPKVAARIEGLERAARITLDGGWLEVPSLAQPLRARFAPRLAWSDSAVVQAPEPSAIELVEREWAEVARREAERQASAERARVAAEAARQEVAQRAAERAQEEARAAAAPQVTPEEAARTRAEAARRLAARRRQIIEEAQAEFRSDTALWAPAQIESTARVEVAEAIRNRLPERAFQARLQLHADEIADGWWTALARAEPIVAGVVADAYLHRSSERGIDVELATARETVAAWRGARPVVAFDGDDAPGRVAERDHRTVRDVGWRKIGALARALRDKFLALVQDAVRRAQGGRGLVAPTSALPPPAAWSDPEVQPGFPLRRPPERVQEPEEGRKAQEPPRSPSSRPVAPETEREAMPRPKPPAPRGPGSGGGGGFGP